MNYPLAVPAPLCGSRWILEFHELRRERGNSGPTRHKSLLLKPFAWRRIPNVHDLGLNLNSHE
jgi:hypothetical protein